MRSSNRSCWVPPPRLSKFNGSLKLIGTPVPKKVVALCAEPDPAPIPDSSRQRSARCRTPGRSTCALPSSSVLLVPSTASFMPYCMVLREDTVGPRDVHVRVIGRRLHGILLGGGKRVHEARPRIDATARISASPRGTRSSVCGNTGRHPRRHRETLVRSSDRPGWKGKPAS